MTNGSPRRVRWVAIGVWGIVAASIVPAAVFAIQQAREERAVDRYLESHGLNGLPVNKDTAVKVSQAVREDFEVDESKWKVLSLSNRPFLRHDTEFLLRAREGLCGQGTRVIVNLLARLGFDATRVTLYDLHFQPVHTLVSVQIGSREFLLDSINTADSVSDFLNRVDVSTADFGLMHYIDDILARREMGRELARRDTAPPDPGRAEFFRRYNFYSYNAFPATKLLTLIGVDWRVFHLERPARWISILAEKPRALMAALALAIALAFDAMLLFAARRRARAGGCAASGRQPGQPQADPRPALEDNFRP